MVLNLQLEVVLIGLIKKCSINQCMKLVNFNALRLQSSVVPKDYTIPGNFRYEEKSSMKILLFNRNYEEKNCVELKTSPF